MDYETNNRFKRLYPSVLNVEGGYVWDKRDPGGATNYGIAFNFNRGYLSKFGITQPEQMVNLTKNQALEIYYRKYWLPSQADEIPDYRLSLAYFDHAVNAGQGEADRLLSKLDKKLWYYAGDGENVDYWWGLTVQYLLHRFWSYCRFKNFSIYGLGWFNRLIHIAVSISKI